MIQLINKFINKADFNLTGQGIDKYIVPLKYIQTRVNMLVIW